MVKMVQSRPNGPKWTKLVKSAPSGPKWSQTIQGDPKWSKMMKNGEKLFKLNHIVQMVINDPK